MLGPYPCLVCVHARYDVCARTIAFHMIVLIKYTVFCEQGQQHIQTVLHSGGSVRGELCVAWKDLSAHW